MIIIKKGSSDANALQKCADWWAQNMALFKKYEKYLIINIANEWVIKNFILDHDKCE